IQVEYKLNPKWSVSGTRDQNGGFGMDGRYRKDFQAGAEANCVWFKLWLAILALPRYKPRKGVLPLPGLSVVHYSRATSVKDHDYFFLVGSSWGLM
ncbi:MAG TPA: hypothetical protein VGP65_14580, partial [Candidatus Angelobacter sp.]|nr:hypothetical protein [Candidatus Angelobacter sp.]